MIMKHNYPFSPPSDNDSPSIKTTSTPETKKSHVIMADEGARPLTENPTKIQGALRRTRAPPRNEHGQMYCDHINCRGRSQTFKRVCEWNKHMDRHERPYKCREAGCELNPGFTYSGGLLRHQREVHKMHLSTKQPLFCPFPNCNRSSGTGFTRKENLEEHKRRRHLEELSDHASNRAPSHPLATMPTIPQENPVKRRRVSTSIDGGFGQGQRSENEVATEPNDVASSEILRLREELRQKDEYIRRQAAELHRLQNLLRSLPPQAIYGVVQPRQPGSGVG
ncbi:uncharacterized protein Z518_06233 [Rhinocladiella mackenziei CBS 650.93]|uniref:C2H2-type domain-containing protein n=1 Tax=Rhinocladiella mackenziei CBS 650.93 TaxID=1442369 RepID=A0A0D2IQ94_9EURO|nr:uncharacterized protein Z518_06233 [Rhinocladiella mackenziei CBS 650.93]KIX05361.1 hypothetical protein Z518_06233 [Rhinocladiella mackenziei CBS 650.93]